MAHAPCPYMNLVVVVATARHSIYAMHEGSFSLTAVTTQHTPNKGISYPRLFQPFFFFSHFLPCMCVCGDARRSKRDSLVNASSPQFGKVISFQKRKGLGAHLSFEGLSTPEPHYNFLDVCPIFRCDIVY